MPYAQWHFPFENKRTHLKAKLSCRFYLLKVLTRQEDGFIRFMRLPHWSLIQLHYKTCVSNGLVLDKNGNKMSKRLGNVVDPFNTIETFGADATRWYLVTNASPWDNMKFDLDGIKEVQRKFFGTSL